MTALTKPDGRKLRSAITHGKILSAARVCAKEGNYWPSISQIADADGVTRRCFYHHFTGIPALMRQVMREKRA